MRYIEAVTAAVPVRSWRTDEFGGMDLLHGTFTTHAFARHTHETYSIGVFEAGTMVCLCQGRAYTMRPGSLGLIQPGDVHTGHSLDVAEGWTYRNLYPDAALFARVLQDLGGRARALPRLPVVMDDPSLAAMFAQAHRALLEPASSLARESLLRVAVSALLLRHASERPALPAVRPEGAAVRQVRAVLEDDPARNVTLEELASMVGQNAFTLLRAFRRAHGLPPHAYQVQVRLRHAKRRLLAGEAPAQVALEVGFADQSHLGRHFRRAFGVTPQQYRRGASRTF